MGLLFYTKVRWLSKGKSFSWLYELKNEVEVFFDKNKNNLDVQFHNKVYVVILAYLTKVFGQLNGINLSLRGRDATATGWLS